MGVDRDYKHSMGSMWVNISVPWILWVYYKHDKHDVMGKSIFKKIIVLQSLERNIRHVWRENISLSGLCLSQVIFHESDVRFNDQSQVIAKLVYWQNFFGTFARTRWLV